MIRKRKSHDEALAERDAFSQDEKKEHAFIKGIRDRLRAEGLKYGCIEVRREAGCGITPVVFHLGILRAIEGPEPEPFITEPDPQVPATAAAMAADAGAQVARFPDILADVLRTGVAEERERVTRSFEARIDDAQNTIEKLHEQVAVANDMMDGLASEARKEKRINVRLYEELGDTMIERDQAIEQNVQLTVDNVALAACNNTLTDQVGRLKAENADVRRLNEVMSQHLFEATQERDRCKGRSDMLPALQLEAAVYREQLSARAAEAASLRGALSDMQERQAQATGQIRESYICELAEAKSRICQLEKLVVSGAQSFAAVD